MNDYIETRVDVTPCNETITDLIAYNLCEIGYESFVPDESGLTAYLPARIKVSDSMVEQAIKEAVGELAYQWRNLTVEGRDWNQEWERNYFQPMVIADRCVIHSSFHKDFPKCEYDIVIDPKMAFGTGHHATTTLIVTELLAADLDGKSVIDMGTGTGILAILAAMRGAAPVTAVEIDPPAHINAVENVALNDHSEINVLLGDVSALADVAPADYFLANINRNVITADIEAYAAHLREGGVMLLSGFYVEDVEIIRGAAEAVGLTYQGFTERDRWACVRLGR